MELSAISNSLNALTKKIDNYMANIPEVELADYLKQQDTQYVITQYRMVVSLYSELLKLLEEQQFFIAQSKRLIHLMSATTELEKAQKTKIKTAIDIINDYSVPLNTEKERLKTIEMFYRGLINR